MISAAQVNPDTIEPAQSNARRPRFNLATILALAFLVRLLLALAMFSRHGDWTGFYGVDTESYLRPAREWVASGAYTSEGEPEINRPPGYALFVAPGLLIGHVEPVTISLQLLASCLAVYVAYRLAQAVFADERISRLAALLLALEPVSVLYTCKLLSEATFTCLLLICLWFLVVYLKRPHWPGLLCAAALLSLATFVRPIAYFLPLCIGAGLLLHALTQSQRRWMLLGQAMAFVVLAKLPVMLWEARNAAIADYPRFAAVETNNLYFFNAASVLARAQQISLAEMQHRLGYMQPETYAQLHPEQRHWTAAQRWLYLHSEAMRIIRASLGVYVRIHLAGVPSALFGTGVTEFLTALRLDSPASVAALSEENVFRRLSTYAVTHPTIFWSNVVIAGLNAALLAAAACGALSGKLLRCWGGLLLLGVCLYFLAISGGPVANHRMRHPIMPIVCILAVHGFMLLLRFYNQRRPGQRSAVVARASDDHLYFPPTTV